MPPRDCPLPIIPLEAPLPGQGTTLEGICWACNGPVIVYWHREYTGMTAVFVKQHQDELEQRRRRGTIGLNAAAIRRANPPFTQSNSQVVTDSRCCTHCNNTRFPQPTEARPARWIKTDRACSACHHPIVDEQCQHPLDATQWVHQCYSCQRCRMLFRDLPT